MTDNVCYHCEDCTAQIIPDCGRCGYTCDQCECDQDCIDRHDAAIRKEERERVLSKLKGTIEDKVFEKDETIFDWLYNEIESLRAGDE